METPFNTIAYTEKYIADQQAKDITDVIAKTDPSIFSTGAYGVIAESYAIRGFRSSSVAAGTRYFYGRIIWYCSFIPRFTGNV